MSEKGLTFSPTAAGDIMFHFMLKAVLEGRLSKRKLNTKQWYIVKPIMSVDEDLINNYEFHLSVTYSEALELRAHRHKPTQY